MVVDVVVVAVVIVLCRCCVSFVLVGLGDIVIPGIFVALLIRFDRSQAQVHLFTTASRRSLLGHALTTGSCADSSDGSDGSDESDESVRGGGGLTWGSARMVVELGRSDTNRATSVRQAPCLARLTTLRRCCCIGCDASFNLPPPTNARLGSATALLPPMLLLLLLLSLRCRTWG